MRGSSEAEPQPLSSARPRSPSGQFIRVVPAPKAPVDPAALPEDRFLDREISWLQFNERVLELAETTPSRCWSAPLPGDLRQQPRRVLHGRGGRSQAPDRDRPGRALASGLEPREVLEQISLVAHELMAGMRGVP
jgi:polyphosphate kinase